MTTADPPHTAPRSARLKLLGEFRLFLAEESRYLPPSGQRLLAFLALHTDGVRRTQAAAILWPRLTDHRAAAGLRSTLWRLSRLPTGHSLVDRADSRLVLAPDLQVDLHQATHTAQSLTVPPRGAGLARTPEHGIPRLLCEELLPSWDDDWLTMAREHYHQSRLHALEALARRLRDAGELCAAMECAMTALESEPLRESAHRQVTETHLAEGNIAAALHHYDTYRHSLRAEFGVAPSSAYRRLLAPYLRRPLDP